MARIKNRPYKILGDAIESVRLKKFRSALALFKDKKMSFSYSSYVDFEKGYKLPPIESLLEITDILEEDPAHLALIWAEVQMPRPELKKLFKSKTESEAPEEAQAAYLSNKEVPKPSMDNTWVFGPKERILLEKHPWLWELFLSIAISYPVEVPIADLKRPPGMSLQELKENYLKPLAKEGYLRFTDKDVGLEKRYLYLPEDLDFDPIRKQNLTRALEGVQSEITPEALQKGEAIRVLLHQPVSAAKAKRWVKRLNELKEEFKSETESFTSDEVSVKTHAFVIVFGKRNLRKSV